MEVRFDGVSFEANGRSIVASVSLTLASGRTTVLVGPSGAGKSTLVKIAAGLVAPTAGRLLFSGEDVTAHPPEDRPIGIAFQEPRLFPFLSVLENVAFPLAARGVAKAEREGKARGALELASAGHLAERGVEKLSGGEAQRVALARAVVHSPPVLLLDEPLASLDAQLRRTLRDDLARLVERVGATTLLVTHDQEDAFALADDLAIARNGRLVEAGAPEELYRRPRDPFTATFLGEGRLVRGTRIGDELDLGFARVPASGDATHALVRPEDLRLASDDDADAFAFVVRSARFAAGRWRLELVSGSIELVADSLAKISVGSAVRLLFARPPHVLRAEVA
jgi:ABC-type Fe3+/spermidine/putrescine transport system ATPase subunit